MYEIKNNKNTPEHSTKNEKEHAEIEEPRAGCIK